MPNSQLYLANNQLILYQDNDGITNARFDGKEAWLTPPQIAMLFDTTRGCAVQHIRNIYREAELQEKRTCKSFLQVQTEGTSVWVKNGKKNL